VAVLGVTQPSRAEPLEQPHRLGPNGRAARRPSSRTTRPARARCGHSTSL
jgi:hypothetical protein